MTILSLIKFLKKNIQYLTTQLVYYDQMVFFHFRVLKQLKNINSFFQTFMSNSYTLANESFLIFISFSMLRNPH